jgi:uncharacterized repeat protein (TIGR02543 family)
MAPRSSTARLASTVTITAVLLSGIVVGTAAPAKAVAATASVATGTVAPVLSYNFDNDSGTAVVDSSGNGYTGTWGGTPAYVGGVSGKAAAISASADSAGAANFVTLPHIAGKTDASSSFSYDFWIDEQSRTGYGSIVSNQDFNSCSDPGLTLYNQATPGVLEACWGQTSGGTKEYARGINSTAITGDWHHVAIVVDRSANTMTYYVDGSQTAQTASGEITAATALNSGLAFSIGGFSGSGVDYGDGHTDAYIDDFNFYDQAIGASQIAGDYASVNPVKVITDGNGTASASSTVPATGRIVTLSEKPATGYEFDSWAVESPSGLTIGSDGKFTAPGGPVVVKANFKPAPVASSDLTYNPSDTVKPVLSYNFNADSGTTVSDASGNGYGGTWAGTSAYGAGISGGAAHITRGHNVKLALASGKTDATGSYSFEFWIKENSYTGDAWIFSNQTGGSCTDAALGYYNDSGSNGVLTGCYGTTAVHVGLGNPPIVGAWHQLAAVVDRTAGTVTWYVDGTVSGTVTNFASDLSFSSGLPFVLGQNGAVNYGSDVDALYDDVNFYDQAISASQIADDFSATNPATHFPLTVDGGGHGTGSSSPLAPGAGATVTLSSSPATGYHFDSWAAETPSTLSISPLGTFTEPVPGTPVTVKANFAPNTYTAKFDGNGATGGSTPPKTLTYDQSATLPANGFERTGYTFVGWSTSTDFPAAYKDQGAVENLAPSGNSTLYALWMPAGSHFVTIAGDSHVTAQSSVATTGFAAQGSTVRLTATPATGYTAAWQVVSPTGLTINSDGTFTMPTQDVVITAVSAPIRYTVSFDANTADGSMAAETFTYDQPTALSPNAFTRTGFGFAGWATTADGQPEYSNGQTLNNLTTTVDGKITLYAVWRKLVAAGDSAAPVLSYDFTGDLRDGSGGGNTGAWKGTPAYVVGFDGLAASVSDGANYLKLPLLPGQTDGSSSFSYEFWMWGQSRTGWGPIISNQNFDSCNNPGVTLFNHATQGQLEACISATRTASISPALLGWHHVAVVADQAAKVMTVYEDGAPVATLATGSTNFDSGLAFNIGGLSGSEADTGDGYTNAYIDDLDFFNSALPAAQVLNDFDATKPSNTALLTKAPTGVTYNAGTSVQKGFLTDTFHAPQVRAGGTVSQPIAGLWNGRTVTTFTKTRGESWLKVDAKGVITGRAPSFRSPYPAEVVVKATDGTTTSTITVEFPIIGTSDAPKIQASTWNLWDAGTHSDDALQKDLAVIARDGLDVIGVQEDGGQFATQLAQALGWYSYEGGQGLGIVSAFPLSKSDVVTATATSPAVGVTADVLGTSIRVWNAALHQGAYGPYRACFQNVTSPAALVAGEKSTTRYAQAVAIASEIRRDVTKASRVPVLFFGDLSSPSGADWTSKTSSAHCGVGATEWPATAAVFGTGLTDSYRKANPDPVTAPGNTWSPFQKFHDAANDLEPQDRIDYVGYAGQGLRLVGSNTLVAGWPSVTNVSASAWTSDHAAVASTFTLGVPPREVSGPTVTVENSTLTYEVGHGPTNAQALLRDAGARASLGSEPGDGQPGDTSALSAQSDADYSTPGDYTALVTATSSGYRSDPVAVLIHVVPDPKIEFDGKGNGEHKGAVETAGVTLTEARAIADSGASLNVPGVIRADLGRVNTAAPGTYPMTLTGTSDDGFVTSSRAWITIVSPDAPVVTPAVSPSTPNGVTGQYGTPPSISATATDRSGVINAFQYRHHGGEWKTYTGGKFTAARGASTYEFRIKDGLGYWSAPAAISVSVAPAVTPFGGHLEGGNGLPPVWWTR